MRAGSSSPRDSGGSRDSRGAGTGGSGDSRDVGAAGDGVAAGDVVHDDLTPDDAMRCAELERLLFAGDGPWSASAFLSEISAPHTSYLAARVAGTLVGYAGLAGLGPAGEREFEVRTVGVDPRFRGRGIGRTLLRRMLAIADTGGGPVFLDVRSDNTPALTLYEAHGFEVGGLRERYYRPSGADAYLMIRPAGTGDTG